MFVQLIAGLALAVAAEGGAEPVAPALPSVFDLPRIQVQYVTLQAEMAVLFSQQKYAEAEVRCRKAAELVPHDPNGQYNLACCLARQGKNDEAIAALTKAVALGFNDRKKIEDDADLAGLRELPEFKKAAEASAAAQRDPNAGWKFTIEPAAIEGGVALVSEKNTAWDGRLLLFRSFFKSTAKPEGPPVNGMGEAGDLVRKWYAEGTAAGNFGDLYDNHDSDHSNMDYGSFPHLARVEFDDAAKQRHLHHGLQLGFLYNGPTLGNSSTALTSGPIWRSQARMALTSPRGPLVLAVQYFSNHLYLYPEHRDYDPGRNGKDGQGYGDVFPANTPYLIVSQGSSGSDQAFLNALALTLAAFRPETKQALAQAGAIAPALQMIFRSSNKPVVKPEDYLSGKAHPPVFDGQQLDPVRMVTMAHDMTAEALPPVAQLKVVEEDQAVPGRDFFDAVAGETLFDTPCAIARVARSVKYERRMVVSAEPSRDLKEKPLQYHWAVLRGDPERVRITPQNAAGSVAEIKVAHHERRPIEPGSAMESSRVDVGLFVHNGTYYSAPAFVSILFLENEVRAYDDQKRIAAVDYAAASQNYADPLLTLTRNWRDEYQYDPSGRLLGWTRTRGDAKERFTADGALVTKTDEQQRPIEAKRVRYVGQGSPGQVPALQQQTSDEGVGYEYASPDDRVGRLVEPAGK